MELKDLKKKYEVLEKRYKLPNFKQLNNDFEIEKINLESDFLLRVIRKIMMDKAIIFLNFFERILTNPAGLPRIYYNYIKTINPNEKEEIDKIYNTLGALSLSSFKLEVSSSEKEESEVIKTIYSTWQSLKPELIKISLKMNKPEGQTVKKEKSYFG